MRVKVFLRYLTLLAVSTAPVLSAQELSHDGNRWFEVEIVAFTHEGLVPDNEHKDPTQINPVYPSRLQPLRDIDSIYNLSADERAAAVEASQPPVPVGPAAGPPPSGDFRLPDPGQDPFIELGPQTFSTLIDRLQGSPNHRVLLATTWRQPALSPRQATAVFLRGGDRFGEHNELEGSVLLNYSNGRVNLGINLWLNEFAPLTQRQAPLWRLPPQPFPLAAEAAPASLEPEGDRRRERIQITPRWQVEAISLLRQGENPPLNRLIYFDHPNMGVILEIRPYLLPLALMEGF